MKYNYVYFVPEEYNKLKKKPNNYYSICVRDLETLSNVIVVSYPLDYKNFFLRFLFAIHTSKKINSKLKLPLQKLWFPYYFKNKFKNDKTICFVVEATYLPLSYIEYCRKRFPGCIFVKLHRDFMRLTQQMNATYSEENLKRYFDYRFSYDVSEAQKYGCFSFDEFESKISIPKKNIEYDVFFAGKAKDRMDKLINAYDKLVSLGLKCYFFITCCKKNERVARPGIEYAKKPMSYYRMLECSMKSKCLLDINQETAVGYTSRFLEGVMYNKKIITNNESVKDSKYFDKRFVLLFSNVDEINKAFFDENSEVDYGYENDFSPAKLIEKIDSIIYKEESKKNGK